MKNLVTYITKHRNTVTIFFLCLLLSVETFIVIAPVLKSGYYSDDQTMSLQRSMAKFDNISPIDYYKNNVNTVINSTKRTNIFYAYFVFPYLLSDQQIYKTVVLAVIIINLLTLVILINVFINSDFYGFIVASLVPPLLQFRLFHDPIMSFYLSQQILILNILISLITLTLFIRNKKLIFLVISVIYFFITIFSYEASYLYIIPIAFIIATKSHRLNITTFKTLIPYILVIMIGITAIYLISTNNSGIYGSSYSGVKPKFAPEQIIETFLIQSSATLPLSYHFSIHRPLFCRSINCFLNRLNLTDLLAVLAIILIYTISITKPKNYKENKNLFVLGLLLMFSPVPLISLSQGYQQLLTGLGFGIGYITVYLQYFGLAIVIGSLIVWTKHIKNKLLKLFLIGLFFITTFTTTLITTQDNRMVITKANTILQSRRLILEKSLRFGLLNDISPETPIFFEDTYRYDPYPITYTDLNSWISGYPWKSKYFAYSVTHKKYNIFTDFNHFNSLPQNKKVIIELSNCPNHSSPQGACVKLLKEEITDTARTIDILYNGTTSDKYEESNVLFFN